MFSTPQKQNSDVPHDDTFPSPSQYFEGLQPKQIRGRKVKHKRPKLHPFFKDKTPDTHFKKTVIHSLLLASGDIFSVQ